MQKKNRIIVFIGIIVSVLLLIVGMIWWGNQPTSTSETATTQESVSQGQLFATQSDLEKPGVDATGHQVTSNDVEEMRQKLLDSGLPADKWAPSDIKKIIIKSSKQGMDPIAFARDNFHGDLE